MRIALLAPASVIHTTRWANALVERGHEIHLISLHQLAHHLDERVHFYQIPGKASLNYVLAVNKVRGLLAKISPEVLNTHYASGYGFLSLLVGFSPTMLSVWGSDVYDFPKRSSLHKWLLQKNLSSATTIGSTSGAMARVVKDLCPRVKIHVTPFGVDTNAFCPIACSKNHRQEQFIVGTVKTLEHRYGIDLLIRAFGQFISEGVNSKLLIYGEGRERDNLIKLTRELGIEDKVEFKGFIPHEKVADALRCLDVYVALSREESFGVAILEASACGLPVIVSDADGPKEIVEDNISGYIVPVGDYKLTADKLRCLASDAGQRERLAMSGRERVVNNYGWERCIDRMEEAIKSTLSCLNE
jgi:L-malate glycosyltransferase